MHTQALAALLGRAVGSDTPLPDPVQIRTDFDRALAAVPEQVNMAQVELMQALGLRK